MRALVLAAGLALAALGAQAQDRSATLADLRTELGQLTQDLQSLRSELVASGPAGFAMAGGDSAIDRMNAMEARLAQLTGQTEQLQNRIDRIVKDGTTRIGDIEFRLCEMEPNCDLGSLTTPDLGGQGGGAAPAPVPGQQGSLNRGSNVTTTSTAGVATEAERADFDRAREVLGQGDFRKAAELFATVAKAHAGGALTSEALFLRGAALDSAGDLQEAGVAWLASFASDPNGPFAADALLGLSRATTELGKPGDGCPYLFEIETRFPDSEQAAEATRRLEASDCDAALAMDDVDVTNVPASEEQIDPEAAFDAEMLE